MSDLVPVFELPPELDGWIVVKASEEALGRGYIVWLERTMPDGTTIRFEAFIHDPARELPMLVPVIAAVTALSAPDVRLSVTRTKTTRYELLRHEERRRLTR